MTLLSFVVVVVVVVVVDVIVLDVIVVLALSGAHSPSSYDAP